MVVSRGSGVDTRTTGFCSTPRSLTGPSNAVDIILASPAWLVTVVVAVHISPYRVAYVERRGLAGLTLLSSQGRFLLRSLMRALTRMDRRDTAGAIEAFPFLVVVRVCVVWAAITVNRGGIPH